MGLQCCSLVGYTVHTFSKITSTLLPGRPYIKVDNFTYRMTTDHGINSVYLKRRQHCKKFLDYCNNNEQNLKHKNSLSRCHFWVWGSCTKFSSIVSFTVGLSFRNYSRNFLPFFCCFLVPRLWSCHRSPRGPSLIGSGPKMRTRRGPLQPFLWRRRPTCYERSKLLHCVDDAIVRKFGLCPVLCSGKKRGDLLRVLEALCIMDTI